MASGLGGFLITAPLACLTQTCWRNDENSHSRAGRRWILLEACSEAMRLGRSLDRRWASITENPRIAASKAALVATTAELSQLHPLEGIQKKEILISF